MRHRVYGKKLGRTKNERTALFKGLINALFLHDSITTTEAKAKAIKGLVDQLISESKRDTQGSRRFVQSMLGQSVVRERLEKEIRARYRNRAAGFTQIVRVGVRKGDGAMMVRMNLIEADKEEPDDDKQTVVEEKKPRKDRRGAERKLRKQKVGLDL